MGYIKRRRSNNKGNDLGKIHIIRLLLSIETAIAYLVAHQNYQKSQGVK